MAGAPTVVFVPGFMQRGEAWTPVAERLGEPYRSVCLDLATWTYADRLAEIRAAAPPSAAIVGYSMGGRLALHAALRWPDAFGALAAVGVSAGIEDAAERAARRIADDELADWMESQPIEAVVERWERMPVFAGQSSALVDAQRRSRRTFEPALLARLLRSAGQGALDPVWGDLASLSPPLMAVAGERDHRYLRAAFRMAALAPRGEAHAIPRAGHAAHLENPEAVAALLRQFLDEFAAP